MKLVGDVGRKQNSVIRIAFALVKYACQVYESICVAFLKGKASHCFSCSPELHTGLSVGCPQNDATVSTAQKNTLLGKFNTDP